MAPALNAKGKPKRRKSAKQKEKRKLKRKAREVLHKEAMIKMTGHGDYAVGRRANNFSHATRLNGKGDFLGDLWDTGKKIAGAGIKAAGWITDKVAPIAGLLGLGDYSNYKTPKTEIKMNSLFNTKIMGAVDSGSLMSKFRVQHREYVTAVQSSASYQIQSFAVNPGLPSSFPWFCNIAQSFQRYKIMGMAVEYVPAVFSYGGADVNGDVCIGVRYDVSLPAPTTISQMENTASAVAGRPVDALLCPLECDPSMNPVNVLEVRSGGLPSNANQQLFDHALIDIVNTGQADANVSIGRVFFVYDIELELPAVIELANGTVLSDHYFSNTGISSSFNLGTSGTMVAQSTIGGTVVGSATSTYSFPSYITSGEWLIVYNSGGSAPGATTIPTWTVTNGTIKQLWGSAGAADGAQVAYGPAAGGTACTNQVYAIVINVTGAAPTVKISGLTLAGTLVCDLLVTQFNGNLVTLNMAKRRWLTTWKRMDEEKLAERAVLDAYIEERFRQLFEARSCPQICEVSDTEAPSPSDWVEEKTVVKQSFLKVNTKF